MQVPLLKASRHGQPPPLANLVAGPEAEASFEGDCISTDPSLVVLGVGCGPRHKASTLETSCDLHRSSIYRAVEETLIELEEVDDIELQSSDHCCSERCHETLVEQESRHLPCCSKIAASLSQQVCQACQCEVLQVSCCASRHVC